MDTILTTEQAKTSGRPIGKVSNDKLTAFIVEIEQTIIRKKLGTPFFLEILSYVKAKREEEDDSTTDDSDEETNTDGEETDEEVSVQSDDTEDERSLKIETLLNGGLYTKSNGTQSYLNGLIITESYFVYAQNVRSGDFESTRYGMRVKDDEYSSSISAKERDQIANSSTEIGNEYLNEVLSYCLDMGLVNPKDCGVSMNITSSCVIRKIKC